MFPAPQCSAASPQMLCSKFPPGWQETAHYLPLFVNISQASNYLQKKIWPKAQENSVSLADWACCVEDAEGAGAGFGHWATSIPAVQLHPAGLGMGKPSPLLCSRFQVFLFQVYISKYPQYSAADELYPRWTWPFHTLSYCTRSLLLQFEWYIST